jgi:hypothetical protein
LTKKSLGGTNGMTRYFVLTPEKAEKFFETCIMKEAIKEEERIAIMEQMIKDDELITSGITSATRDELVTKLSKVASVLMVNGKRRNK